MAQAAQGGLGRSPTFFVGAQQQRKNLGEFKKVEQQLTEAYFQNKPLCFRGRGYQKTHPVKAARQGPGVKDADARLEAPMILGVADGVSQIEDFGIDASELPNKLLRRCKELGMRQLIPGATNSPEDAYRGPIPLVREAFERTGDCLGSTTLVLAVLDNSTRIHGKLHPMIAVISIGDCELLILRRLHGQSSALQPVFHTEMQRIDGHFQTPLQLARVDDRIDPDFHDDITIEVIEKGSAVHCVSAYEGDIVVMGSDGVFDNLFLDEVAELCNAVMQPGRQGPVPDFTLEQLARQIVEACHAKTQPNAMGAYPEAPIGRGGKVDDTSCTVAEVVEWTEAHKKKYTPQSQNPMLFFKEFLACGSGCAADDDEDDLEEYDGGMRPHGMRSPRHSRYHEHSRTESRIDESSSSDDEPPAACVVA